MNGLFGGGVGTKNDPIIIEDIQDLKAIEQKVTDRTLYNKGLYEGNMTYILYFKLMKNISTPNGWSGLNLEIPTGYLVYFDGNNHIIHLLEHRTCGLIKNNTNNSYVFISNTIFKLNNYKVTNSSALIGKHKQSIDDTGASNITIDHCDIELSLQYNSGIQHLSTNNGTIQYCNIKVKLSGMKFIRTEKQYIEDGNKAIIIDIFGSYDYRNIIDWDIDTTERLTLNQVSNDTYLFYIDIKILGGNQTISKGNIRLDLSVTYIGENKPINNFRVQINTSGINNYSDTNITAKLKYYIEYNRFGEIKQEQEVCNFYIENSSNMFYNNGEINGPDKPANYTYSYNKVRIDSPNNNAYYNRTKIIAETSEIFFVRKAKPLTDGEMHIKEYFVDNNNKLWDFDLIWGIDPTINDGYPYLRWFNYEIVPIIVGFTLKVKHPSGIIDIPFYNMETPENGLIFSLGQLNGKIKLVDIDDTNALPVRIMTDQGIKAFSK